MGAFPNQAAGHRPDPLPTRAGALEIKVAVDISGEVVVVEAVKSRPRREEREQLRRERLTRAAIQGNHTGDGAVPAAVRKVEGGVVSGDFHVTMLVGRKTKPARVFKVRRVEGQSLIASSKVRIAAETGERGVADATGPRGFFAVVQHAARAAIHWEVSNERSLAHDGVGITICQASTVCHNGNRGDGAGGRKHTFGEDATELSTIVRTDGGVLEGIRTIGRIGNVHCAALPLIGHVGIRRRRDGEGSRCTFPDSDALRMIDNRGSGIQCEAAGSGPAGEQVRQRERSWSKIGPAQFGDETFEWPRPAINCDASVSMTVTRILTARETRGSVMIRLRNPPRISRSHQNTVGVPRNRARYFISHHGNVRPSSVGRCLPEHWRANVELLRQAIRVHLVGRADGEAAQINMPIIHTLIRIVRTINSHHRDPLLQTHATVVPVKASVEDWRLAITTNPSR